MSARVQILVRGMVQGVGFRPFVYSQANKRALKGRVRNSNAGVFIDVEGESSEISQFVEDLKSSAPPLSSIESVDCRTDLEPANYAELSIVESEIAGKQSIPISADIATCEDCLMELFDSADRRYRYPFINCTGCGPRF